MPCAPRWRDQVFSEVPPMAITVLDPSFSSPPWLRALGAVARAAFQLPVAALRHPGKRLAINRASGRVVLR